jgi:hypothetical protein
VIMADTGDEHRETYEHVKHCERLCEKHGVEFLLLSPKTHLGFFSETWQSLIHFYRGSRTVGSKRFIKSCTSNLKIRPIYRFLNWWVNHHFFCSSSELVNQKKALLKFSEQNGRIKVLVGIAKGEEKRVMDPAKQEKWMQKSIEVVYPLIDLGLDRAGCQEYIKSVDQPVPLPSNCMRCPFLSKVELLWMYRFRREAFDEWVELEATRDTKKQRVTVWGTKTLLEVLAEAQAEHGHMSDAELQEYKMSHGHCVASKY